MAGGQILTCRFGIEIGDVQGSKWKSLSTAASASLGSLPTSSYNWSAARVGAIPRPSRLKSGDLVALLNLFSPCVTDGCEILSRSAAAVTEPSSMTATNTRIRFKSTLTTSPELD